MEPERFVFAHLADAHVGAWPRAPAVRAALRESVLRALAVVEERDAEFLLVSGDLFHTPVPDPAEVAPIAAALKRLVDAGRRIYVIYGSHDYVAHRTSWLDVLAAAGVFVKVAPEAVRAEGTRWTLPFQVDGRTGARIAGISGRSHGLDREYFRSVDAEGFLAEPGFRIFQFHAAIEEYLPEGLREHVRGIRRDDLPTGCGYYAGGHIHRTYTGEGPGGGLLVNPGAVFGTSRTDVENLVAGRTHAGVVIVTVEHGRARAEFVETAPRDALRLADIDVSGKDPEGARAELERQLAPSAGAGALLFPRVHGSLADGSPSSLALAAVARTLEVGGGSVTWDVRDLAPATADASSPERDLDIEGDEIAHLIAETAAAVGLGPSEAGDRQVRELLRELGEPRAEGQTRIEYEGDRISAARRTLGITAPRTR